MARIAICAALMLSLAGCGHRPASTGTDPEVDRQFAGLWSVGPEQGSPSSYPTYLRLRVQAPTELLCGNGSAGCFGGALGPATTLVLADGRQCTFGLDFDSALAPIWQSRANDRLIFEAFCEPGPHVSLEFVFRTAPAGNASAQGARVELERVDGQGLSRTLGSEGIDAFRWWRFRRCAGNAIESC